MHDGAAGKVEHAPLKEPAIRRPHPMGQGAVDESCPQHDEDDVAAKAHAFGDGARDERRRDDGELALKHDKNEFRDALIAVELSMRDSGQSQIGPIKTEEAAHGLPEGEAVAHQHPLHADDGHGDEAVHHGVEHAARAHHATVKQGQPWDHQQNHRRAGEHPGGAAGVEGDCGAGHGSQVQQH